MSSLAAGKALGFCLLVIVACAGGTGGGSVGFEVTDRNFISAICPAPVWNESRQKLEYPELRGVLFGRPSVGASRNASETAWSPLNATCNCSHNKVHGAVRTIILTSYSCVLLPAPLHSPR
jgi:hypothetical protein